MPKPEPQKRGRKASEDVTVMTPEEVRQVLIELGWNFKTASEKLGMNPGTISRYAKIGAPLTFKILMHYIYRYGYEA